MKHPLSRKYIGLLLSLFLVLNFSACTQTESDPSSSHETNSSSTQATIETSLADTPKKDIILPYIPEYYWELFDTHCSIVYEPGFMATSGVSFTLLSAFPIQDMSVKNQNGDILLHYLSPFHGFEEELTPDVLSEDLFLLYQGFQPETILHATGANNDLWEAQQIYRSTDPNELPTLYWYTLEILVDWESDEALTDIVVTVGEESKSYSIGSIANRMNEEIDYPWDSEFALNCDDNLSYFGHPVDIASEGVIKINNVHYTAQKDLHLTGLYFYRSTDLSVDEISVAVTVADGTTIDTLWDGQSPFSLSAGETIALNLIITDPFFSDSLGGTAARYLMLEYSVDGQTFELGIPFYFRQSAIQPFIYIAAKDGLDAVGYCKELYR